MNLRVKSEPMEGGGAIQCGVINRTESTTLRCRGSEKRIATTVENYTVRLTKSRAYWFEQSKNNNTVFAFFNIRQFESSSAILSWCHFRHKRIHQRRATCCRSTASSHHSVAEELNPILMSNPTRSLRLTPTLERNPNPNPNLSRLLSLRNDLRSTVDPC